MNGKSMVALLTASLVLVATTAEAKLPSPDSREIKARQAAAEKKAKDDESAKNALARAQDRIAARYKAKRRK